jgi:hypothetical protein
VSWKKEVIEKDREEYRIKKKISNIAKIEGVIERMSC